MTPSEAFLFHSGGMPGGGGVGPGHPASEKVLGGLAFDGKNEYGILVTVRHTDVGLFGSG